MADLTKQIAALDTPQVTQGADLPKLTVQRTDRPLSPPEKPVQMRSNEIDVKIREGLSNAFVSYDPVVKMYRHKPGQRIVVMVLNVGDGK